MSHLSFHQVLCLSSFCIILTTNKHTNTDENITLLVEVMRTYSRSSAYRVSRKKYTHLTTAKVTVQTKETPLSASRCTWCVWKWRNSADNVSKTMYIRCFFLQVMTIIPLSIFLWHSVHLTQTVTNQVSLRQRGRKVPQRSQPSAAAGVVQRKQ